jgi:hypothetical protein
MNVNLWQLSSCTSEKLDKVTATHLGPKKGEGHRLHIVMCKMLGLCVYAVILMTELENKQINKKQINRK